MKTYNVTFWLSIPGQCGSKLYKKAFKAKNETGAVIAFNTWIDNDDRFPNGTEVEITKTVEA